MAEKDILKEIYEAAKEEGYEKSFEDFKLDLKNRIETQDTSEILSEEELSNIAGGISAGSKRVLAAALSLAAISPMNYNAFAA